MSVIIDAYIIGDTKVGSDIKAVFIPNNIDSSSITYQWFKSSTYTDNYVIIEDATSAVYTIKSTDKYLKCLISDGDFQIFTNILVVNQTTSTAVQLSDDEILSIGRGLSYEQLVSEVSGSSNIVYDITRINQSINLILSTAKSEVPMIPTLGTNLHKMIFEGATDDNITLIEVEVDQALVEQEPRINVLNVEATYDEWHTVHILIEYTIRNTNIKSSYIYVANTNEEVA